MDLYIARHGETEFNVEHRVQGSGKDAPLTLYGIEQAKALGKSLEGISFDAVFSSPQKRAVDTVEIAFAGKYKPVLDERLVEIGLGVIEGMIWAEVMAAYPDCGFLSDPSSYNPPPKGESLTDMIKRVNDFMEDIKKLDYEKVFVMAHGYVLRVFYACAIDKSISAIGKAPHYKNCEIVHYLYENDKWELLAQ